MRWPIASLSNPQRGCLVGASSAWPAPKTGVRNRSARCHDSRFIRPGRHLFRYTQRTALWFTRRRKDVAKNTRGVPVSVVRAKRSRGGPLWQANFAEGYALANTSNQSAVEKQNAAAEQVIPCQSLFTFRGRCGNLPPDSVESRSSTQPQHCRRHCL